jgi:adenylate kinase family enzyme
MHSKDAPEGRRILVVGCSGAGKTTFAHKLAGILALPLIQLDLHYWRPGWQQPSSEEWRQQVTALADAPEWLMDGNYSSTYDLRMPRADTLIWFDYPRATCLRRVLWRTLKGYGGVRSGLPDGCPERFELTFLRYIWDFRTKHRPRIVTAIERLGGHLQVLRLTRDSEADALLEAAGQA